MYCAQFRTSRVEANVQKEGKSSVKGTLLLPHPCIVDPRSPEKSMEARYGGRSNKAGVATIFPSPLSLEELCSPHTQLTH